MNAQTKQIYFIYVQFYVEIYIREFDFWKIEVMEVIFNVCVLFVG